MKSEKVTICKRTKNKKGVLRYSPLVCVMLGPSALGKGDALQGLCPLMGVTE